MSRPSPSGSERSSSTTSGADSESQRVASAADAATDGLKTAAVQRICERLGDRLLVLDEQHGDPVGSVPSRSQRIG